MGRVLGVAKSPTAYVATVFNPDLRTTRLLLVDAWQKVYDHFVDNVLEPGGIFHDRKCVVFSAQSTEIKRNSLVMGKADHRRMGKKARPANYLVLLVDLLTPPQRKSSISWVSLVVS
jgi:hypothetical protein